MMGMHGVRMWQDHGLCYQGRHVAWMMSKAASKQKLIILPMCSFPSHYARQEHHCKPVTHLVSYQASGEHLVASLGDNQLTVYTGTHLGHHIGVVVRYTHEASECSTGGRLRSACWLPPGAVAGARTPGDICLAVGGEDRAVSLISLAEARVLGVLSGHSASVVGLAGVPANAERPGRLAALSTDAVITLWDTEAMRRVWSLKIANAHTLVRRVRMGCCPASMAVLGSGKVVACLAWMFFRDISM